MRTYIAVSALTALPFVYSIVYRLMDRIVSWLGEGRGGKVGQYKEFVYLGDNIYAQPDDLGIKILGSDPEDPTGKVYLRHSVLELLDNYRKQWKKEKANGKS